MTQIIPRFKIFQEAILRLLQINKHISDNQNFLRNNDTDNLTLQNLPGSDAASAANKQTYHGKHKRLRRWRDADLL